MAKKCTLQESARRTQIIYEMLSGFKSKNSIVQHCSDEWGVGERQAEKYLARARELMQKDFQIERKDLAAQVLSGYLAVYRKAMEQNQLSNSVGALAGIARLTGLEPKQGKGK